MLLGSPVEGVVEFSVVLNDAFIGEVLLGLDHDASDLGILLFDRELVEIESLIDGPAEAFRGEVLKEEAVTGVVVEIEVLDGILESAGGVRDGQGAVSGSNHLGESAWFEGRGHEDKVRPSVAEVGE